VSPVSPLKKVVCRGPASTIDDHSVVFLPPMPRPEKCCDGAAEIASPRPTSTLSHQSSSMIRFAATPHASRCAPTPSDVTKGTSRFASSTMVV
jgi:hypothetical protein